MKKKRPIGKAYHIEVFRKNHFLPKYLFKTHVSEAGQVTVVEVEMSKIYNLRINLYDAYGRKITVADVAANSGIIHGGGIILDIDAKVEEQFVERIKYKPLIPPKVNIEIEDQNESQIETEENPNSNIKELKQDEKKQTFKIPKGLKGSVKILTKNGKPIPPNSTIEGKLYCLPPEIFLNADKGALLSRSEISSLEEEIKEMHKAYENRSKQDKEVKKTLIDSLMEENRRLKLENDKLKIGNGAKEDVKRFSQLVNKRYKKVNELE